MKNIFLVILFYKFSFVFGQPERSVIPASPNVASLVSYTDIPVGKYTGIPDINIPLYTVKSGALQLPLSLSYNASGIRTNQEASWVGLGWSLQAGGVISHSIRGKDDFDKSSTGYWKHSYPTEFVGDRKWVRPVETNNSAANYLQRTFNGTLDPEPDIFSYSFAGHSGKFYMDKNAGGTGPVIRLIDQKENLKISLVLNEEKFIITDGNGIKYFFGTPEYCNTETKENNWAVNRMPPPTQNIEYVGTGCMDNRHISGIYLDRIVSPAGDEISFVYAVPEPCTGLLSQTELNAQYFKNIREVLSPNAFSLPGNYINYTYSRTLTEEVILQYINFKNGYVSFIATSSRDDLNSFGLYTPKKLDAIGIATNGGQTKKEIRFRYSYFNNTNNPSYSRLKLDELYTAEAPYRFTYETSIPLPDKHTFSTDHWGYYNARSNINIIPSSTFDYAPLFEYGANREVNPDVIQAGILREIEYPTGGKSIMEYEPNDFYTNTSEPAYEDGNHFLEASQHYYQGTQDPFEELDFFLPPRPDGYDIPVKVGYYSNSIKQCEFLPEYSGEPFAVLVKVQGPGTGNYSNVEDYISNYSKADIIDIAHYSNCENPVIYEDERNYELSSGWYRIVIQAPEYFVSSSIVSYHYIKSFNENFYARKGAGLRVKKMTVTDGLTPSVISYEYKNENNSSSSGKLMTAPIYSKSSVIHLEDHYTMNIGGVTVFIDDINVTNYEMIKSESFSQLSTTAQGSYVGYDRVTEIFGENGENGKKVNSYMNSTASGIFYAPSRDIISNGLLLSETVYNSKGDLVSKVENGYVSDADAEKSIHGFSVNTLPFLYDLDLHPLTNYDPFPEMAAAYYLTYYTLYSNWVKLSNSITTVFSTTGNLITTINYEYNAGNKQLAKEIKTSGQNTELITRFKYPHDYSNNAGTVYNEMIAANFIDQPVEIQTWKNNNGTETLISSDVIEYKDHVKAPASAGKFIVPFKTYKLIAASPLTSLQCGQTSSDKGPFNNLLFDPRLYEQGSEINYDGYGNITAVITAVDPPRSYVWGYGFSLPIAAAVNALPAEIFFTGFEDDGVQGTAHTGLKFYNGDFALQFSIPNSRTYIYSYWYRQSGVWKFSGILPYAGATIITDGDAIDDVRVYPADAEMTTYTYIPLVGISSITDINNRVSTYEYDALSRLWLIRDNEGNILKKYCYNYTGTQENCQ
jgi:hypothetical protein